VGEEYDAIIVGSDLAAGTAAVALVGARGRVLCIDPFPGSAGPGGCIWPAELDALRPELAGGLPGIARLVEHRWQIVSDPGVVSVDYREGPSEERRRGPWLIQDRKAGRWLLQRAGTGGADLREGTPTLLESAGAVNGVGLDDREIRAPVTLISDPAALGASRRPLAAGVSVTYRLPGRRVQDRFGVRAGQGASIEAVLAFAPAPALGIGFVQGFGESVTVGVYVVSGKEPVPTGILTACFERFLAHPSVAGLVTGGVPETPSEARYLPVRSLRSPFSSGALAIGRAGGWDLGAGPISTGPGVSIRSALVAAEAVREHWKSGSPLRPSVATRFAQRLRASGIPGRLADQARRSRRVAFRPGMHHEYPVAIEALLHRLLTETGERKESVVAAVRATRRNRRVPLLGLALDAVEAGGSL
jgi:flavin-dependent dehydrogenase